MPRKRIRAESAQPLAAGNAYTKPPVLADEPYGPPKPPELDGPPDQPITVYYLHDEDHRLLYVGVTSTQILRMNQHRRDKGWWTDVAYASMEHFGTRAEAERREAEAIAKLDPKYNATDHAGPRFLSSGIQVCTCGCRKVADKGRWNANCYQATRRAAGLA